MIIMNCCSPRTNYVCCSQQPAGVRPATELCEEIKHFVSEVASGMNVPA